MTHQSESPEDESEPEMEPVIEEVGQDTILHPKENVPISDSQDRARIVQFVTTLKNVEEQIGEHTIRALQHADTVAVLTTVVMGPDGQQRIVSAALNPSQLQQVQEILRTAAAERQEQEPCFGFHCLVNPKPGNSST